MKIKILKFFIFPSWFVLLIALHLLFLQGCNSAVEGVDDQDIDNTLEKSSCSNTPPIARFYFNESADSTIINDSSGLQPPVNLAIRDANAVSFLSNGLAVSRSTIINSDQNQNTADRIITALRSSNALTAELWIEPDNTTQNGPARIVSISMGYYDRNLTIGQEADQYILRLRTSTTNDNGKVPTSASDVNPLITARGTVRPTLTHLVLTWDSVSANASYYIDGTHSASTTLEGDFSTWIDGYPLMIANEINDNRTWLGKYYYLAIYDCAVEESQIADSFSNGVPTANQ